MTIFDARCSALISNADHGGRFRMMTSGSSPASVMTSATTTAPSGWSLAAIALFGANEPGGLRIVDDEKIFHELHTFAVQLVVAQKDVEDLLGRVEIAAMERIVKALGDFEEVVAAGYDLPLGLHFDFLHERDQAVQDLGDASANGGGVHHLDRLAA